MAQQLQQQFGGAGIGEINSTDATKKKKLSKREHEEEAPEL